MLDKISFRFAATPADKEHVRKIIDSTGFFYNHEIDVAVDLVQETLDKGEVEGYRFIFADFEGKTIGYSCYGLIPCTKTSYDLYWIAVHNDFRNSGLGKQLLNETEKKVKELGGTGIYIETSAREKYIPTQKFYEKNNCDLQARFKDFYDVGDDKLVYVKTVK